MSRARDLSKIINPSVFTVDSSNNVGLNSTSPSAKLGVSGIVSATAFYGDGSNLEGVASAGLGTALADEGAGAVIYYTDKTLGVAADVTVDVPDASSSNVAYTQYEEISVDSGVDFIVADGDDFVPDILGISSDVQQPGLLSGGGGRVRADNLSNKAGDGAPALTFGAEVPVGYGITGAGGINITGVATAASFSGTVASSNLSGALPALDGSALTNLNIPAGFNELDAALFN